MSEQKLNLYSRRDLFRVAKDYGLTSTFLAAGALTGVVTLPQLSYNCV